MYVKDGEQDGRKPATVAYTLYLANIFFSLSLLFKDLSYLTICCPFERNDDDDDDDYGVQL